jgi:hypothetical protein
MTFASPQAQQLRTVIDGSGANLTCRRVPVGTLGFTDDHLALLVEGELKRRAPARHLALDAPKQADAVRVREACRNRPIQPGTNNIADEYDLRRQQDPTPVLVRQRLSGFDRLPKARYVCRELVQTLEAHPDRELLGASSGTSPLTESTAKELPLLDGQVVLHILGHDGSLPASSSASRADPRLLGGAACRN